MKELTTDTLNEIIENNQYVVVQYGASWCGACRIIKPQFSKLSQLYDNVEFYYIDAENLPKARGLAKVENLPTFASFQNGELVKQVIGTRIEAIKGMVDEITSH